MLILYLLNRTSTDFKMTESLMLAIEASHDFHAVWKRSFLTSTSLAK